MVYKKKYDWISKYVRNKEVLDLGCVCHNLDKSEEDNWLHRKILKDAKRVVGVDYLENEILTLKKRGYNVICANVETMKLNEKFNLIVAGDIIEHLSNMGQFIDRVKEHLDSDGIFLLSTVNPINLFRFLRQLVTGNCGANKEHTCWLSEQVLNQLMERYGLEIIDVGYVDDSYQYYKKIKWWGFYPLNYILCRIQPAFCETLCVALKVKSKLIDAGL